MAKKHEMRTCQSCGETQSVRVRKPNHILHIIMSVITCGVWLIIYAAAGFESLVARKPRCFQCKAKIS